MRDNTSAFIQAFFQRNPGLACVHNSVAQAIEAIIGCYAGQGKVLAAGCGGSMADAEHITGELLKGFRLKRPLDPEFSARYRVLFGEEPPPIDGSLPAVCLTGNAAIMTAVCNDIGGDYAFAQTALGLANPGDAFIAVSASGNSRLLIPAMKVAKAKGAVVIALTGSGGGRMRGLADISILAPAAETFLVQELHVRIYHLICAAMEEEFYG